MSTIYTASYTNQPVAKARAPLVVPNGKKSCFAIGFPAEGFLQRLTVYQSGGTNKAFTVELLNSLIPFAPGDYVVAAAAAAPLEPFRIQSPPTAALSANSGAVLTFTTTDEIGIAYRNLDGSQNEEKRFLYLLINPTSAVDDTTWCVYLQARIEARS